MRRQQLLGLVAALVLMVGVFVPILSLPVFGSINYFGNGRGDGTVVFVLALLSLLAVFARRCEWLFMTGVGSLAIEVFTLFVVETRLAEANADMETRLADNPFRGLAEAATRSVELQWGWVVLVIGSGCLIAAALLRDDAEAITRLCAFCAEPVAAQAKLCKHCKSVLPAHDAADLRPNVSRPRLPLHVIAATVLVVVIGGIAAWATPYIAAHSVGWMVQNCAWDGLRILCP